MGILNRRPKKPEARRGRPGQKGNELSDERIPLPGLPSQVDQWPQGPLTVDLRSPGAKVNGRVKAFANVTIPFGADGAITISGFSILCVDGRVLRVVPPGRKGNQQYFDIVTLTGYIRRLVERAILAEYERWKASAGGGA